ncbi:hypothetical protein [Luteipulveratus flavus]|uniref:TolB protein n=1 Tax=Luteipulveratus flavus TaxID=3031728 RepID=A0ABT6C474_9MICO|nr:hypothetical protein [Luteipulveratus sp. YIM 133296]MDF8263530.1 hypothetical protein [Luteipulveratus sp. YIM 133296]
MKRTLIAGIVLMVTAGTALVPEAGASTTADGPTGRLLYVDLTASTDSGGPLRSATPSGGSVQDLGKEVSWYASPSYSPDGTQIAYTGGDIGFSVMLMNADGTGDHRLIDAPWAPAYPRWRPDGRAIVFQYDGIAQVPVTGGPFTQLTPKGRYELMASWAPSGKAFATAAPVEPANEPDPSTGSVRIWAPRGQTVRKIFSLPGAMRVDWSPDGRTIAASANGDLYFVDSRSGAVRRITNTPGAQERDPIWSPDGSWLAYSVDPTDVTDSPPSSASTIWFMDRNGGNRRTAGVHGVATSWRSGG